ncbi:hypothetical protein Dsin_021054 [Dipteronia sinensis]|uniref:RNase H type-1 domain-containing protein n=1 Tax=Dipteronia sinensis TaxID=43782 RepID=A0AAE0ABJ9_9ROSI|nr:hypothetical protein Dsin_021054 [Dipteronia sinensis]
MFSFFVGVQDSNRAEVLVVHKAVDLFCSSPLYVGRNVVFESDSRVAVSWINGKGIGSYAHVNCIYNIRSNLKFLGGEVKFKSRASNHFADRLAKLGSSIEGDFVEWRDFGG